MDIEKLLDELDVEEFDLNESATLLSYFIPMSPDKETKDESIEDKLDFKNVEDKIVKGPESYLDSACTKVANLLKDKNIYATASIKNKKYMYLFLDKLSEENMEILKSKFKSDSKNFFLCYDNSDYFGIKVDQSGKEDEEISQEFLDLASDFQMQDVQRGFYTEKNFLMNVCNCEKVEGLKEIEPGKAQIVFDVNKMEKSFRDYLKESGYEDYYLQDEHRVYLNEFFYNAHQNYLKT